MGGGSALDCSYSLSMPREQDESCTKFILSTFWSALAYDGSKLVYLDFEFMGFLNARTHLESVHTVCAHSQHLYLFMEPKRRHL